MSSMKKDTLAVNRETFCPLRVVKDCNKNIGDEIVLSNKLKYRIVEIKHDRIIVEYAQPFGLQEE